MRPMALAALLGTTVAAWAASAAGQPTGTVRAQVRVNPLSVAVVVPTDPPKVGKDFSIRANVSNAGSTPQQNVAVTLVAPQALVLREPVTQTIPRIGQVEVKGVRWNACTTVAGGYVVMARAIAGPFTAESLGQIVQVKPAKSPAC